MKIEPVSHCRYQIHFFIKAYSGNSPLGHLYSRDTAITGKETLFLGPATCVTEFDFLDEVFGQWMLFVLNWG